MESSPLSRLLGFLDCIGRPLVCLTTAERPTEADRLTFGNIVSDLECGSAASIEMIVSNTEPDIEDQTYSAGLCAQSEENTQGTLSGPNMEDRGESVYHASMAEQLRGIGTSFEGLEIPDENDLSG